MDIQTEIRTSIEGLSVEIEMLPISVVEDDLNSSEETAITDRLKAIESQLQANRDKVDILNKEIDRLTNEADGLDYAVAAGCGVICGLYDSFFVGEFDWGNAKKWSYQKVNHYVEEYAHEHGYTGKSHRLKNHIDFLQEKYKIPSDNLWSGKDVGISAKSHHLDDWAHHPSPLGWMCSVLTQFTRKGYFTNSSGQGMTFDVENQELIGDTIPEKFAAGTFNWFGHLISDIAGSSSTAGAKGMGLPGPIVTIVKEISSLPGINKTKLPKLVNDVFVKQKFDLRKELALAHELGRQAIPVLINEVLVRLFYFLRRLIQEWKEFGFAGIHWSRTIPFRNRTIVRMVTIASATFTAVDMADAAIRAGIKSKGVPAAFWASFVLRINFVGVGRLVLAVTTDACMGVKLGRKRWERIVAVNEQLHLLNAKVEIKNANVWIEAKATGEEIRHLYEKCADAQLEFEKTFHSGKELVDNIHALKGKIKEKNPGLLSELSDFLDDL